MYAMTDGDDQSGLLDLYHRTSLAAAGEVARTGAMQSLENTQEAFFSTHPDGHVSGYGDALIHIQIPVDWLERGWARIDDEFELDDGEWETHYAIRVDRLRPQHFVGNQATEVEGH
jgi:hypothetical protein